MNYKEVNEVNGKILLIALASAVVLLFAAVPVIAEPTNGQKVPATLMSIPVSEVDPDYWRTNGDIGQARGGKQTYRLFLNIDGVVTTGFFSVLFDEVINFKTDMFVRRYTTVDLGTANGFAGNVLFKIYNYYAGLDVHFDIHCLLHGYGSFEGQTLMLSCEGPNPFVWTGYCLKG